MKMLRAALLLTACLLLALPAGWCCLVALPTPPAAPAEKASADCCTSCCPKPCCPKPAPREDDPPTRAPMTVCCCENYVSLPQGGVKYVPDAVVATLPPAEDDSALATHLDGATAHLCLSPPRALHVLRCLWLC